MFQDRRVREALGLMFDFEWMNANLFYGSYTRTTSYFSNSELASSGLPSEGELLILSAFRGRVPDELFTTEYRVPVSDGTNAGRENAPQGAGAVAGGRLDGEGPQAGQRPEPALQLRDPAEQPDLRAGRAALRPGPATPGHRGPHPHGGPAQYQKRTDEFDFDMTVDLIPQSLSPGNEQRDFFSSEKAKEPAAAT
jgi:microcin C transport system substrate-binding protein